MAKFRKGRIGALLGLQQPDTNSCDVDHICYSARLVIMNPQARASPFRYSKLFGTDVDINTALDLADIARAAELEEIR